LIRFEWPLKFGRQFASELNHSRLPNEQYWRARDGG
jgi:hypothetical protein